MVFGVDFYVFSIALRIVRVEFIYFPKAEKDFYSGDGTADTRDKKYYCREHGEKFRQGDDDYPKADQKQAYNKNLGCDTS